MLGGKNWRKKKGPRSGARVSRRSSACSSACLWTPARAGSAAAASAWGGGGPDEAVAPRRTARTYAEMVGTAHETETALICALPTSAFRPSPGHRVLWVCPAAPDVLDTLGPHISTIGISGALGVPLPDGVRRCPLGQMQRPPLTWVHDGQPNLLPMLRE